MGIHVKLYINPAGIEPGLWARIHDETLALLEAWPVPLLGWGTQTIEGERMAMYLRSLRHGSDAPVGWTVVGDRQSYQTAECQTLYRDLQHYGARAERRTCTDIVAYAANPELEYACGPARVFGDKTQGYPFHFAVLAAAMLVEARAPLQAMVAGDIDKTQAESARALARGILGWDLPVPVTTDAPRLMERLACHFKGVALARAFDRVFVGEPEEGHAFLLRAFPGTTGETWWLQQVKAYRTPDCVGVTQLFVAWLNSGRSLSRACRLA